MRAVVDTNVLIAGLFWHGRPHVLLEHLRAGSLAIVTSPDLLAELGEVLSRARFASILARSITSPEQLLVQLRLLAEVIEPPPLARPVCRDPDDDAVPAVARAAGTDAVVSGDRDLLSLGSFEGIPILTVAQALQRIEGLQV